MAKSGTIRVGIGGWTFEPWRGEFYPKGLPHAQELSYASRAPHLDRGQRHILPDADAQDVRQVEERDARRFRVRAQRPALRRQPPRARRGRRFHQALSAIGPARARRPAGTDTLAVRADEEIRRGGLRRIPGAAAGLARRSRAAPHGRGAPSHVLHAGVPEAGAKAFRSPWSSPSTRAIPRSPTSPATSSTRGCKRATTP